MTRWVMLASVLGVVAACGDDGNTGQLADAPPSTTDARPDSAPPIDGPPIDAAPLPVTVTVTLGGVPAPGQTVYFQSADSTTTATVPTGTDGVASNVVEAGGFVTVIDPLAPDQSVIGPNTHLTTFAGVQPGDHLFRDVPVTAAQGASVQFTITVPNEELNYDYVLYSTCGSAPIGRGLSPRVTRPARGRTRSAIAATPVTNTVQLFGCGGTADLLVVGADSEGGVHSWQYQPNVALTAGGTVTVASYVPAVDQAYAYTGLPSTARVSVSRELRTPRGSLYTANAFAFFDGSAGSAAIPMPTPAGVLAITTSTDELFDGFSRPTVIDWGANTDYTLDFTATALHGYTDEASIDIPTHAAIWTEAVNGQTPQLTVTTMQNSRTDDSGLHSWTWNLVTPWREGIAAFPVLPTTLFDFNAAATDSPSVLRLTTARVPGGYDAARPRVFAGDLEGGVAGASGQIVFEDVFVSIAQLGARTAPRSVRRAVTPRAR